MTMTRPSTRTDDSPPEHVNEVRLVGRLAVEPSRRELPSGDVLVSFRLVVGPQPGPSPPGRAGSHRRHPRLRRLAPRRPARRLPAGAGRRGRGGGQPAPAVLAGRCRRGQPQRGRGDPGPAGRAPPADRQSSRTPQHQPGARLRAERRRLPRHPLALGGQREHVGDGHRAHQHRDPVRAPRGPHRRAAVVQVADPTSVVGDLPEPLEQQQVQDAGVQRPPPGRPLGRQGCLDGGRVRVGRAAGTSRRR